MYFIIGILICIFVIGIIFLNLVKIILNKKDEPYKKILNIALYIIAITTFINILLATYSFFKTKNKVALVGDRGMKGPKGKKGNKGICDSKCGQKVCYIRVFEHVNKYFSKRMNEIEKQKNENADTMYEIKNEEFKNMINKICSSEKYTNIISQKRRKKPNEAKLIKYLENTIQEWIDYFLEYNPDKVNDIQNYLGVKYLLDKYLTFEDIKNVDNKFADKNVQYPLHYISKYDIYSWTGNEETSRLKLNIKSQNVVMPKVDEPRLFILKTNNYTKVYDTKMKKDVWDTTYCKYNQMGEDASNPNKINSCVYINPNSKLKEYKGAWKKLSYQEAPPLSLYNVKSFKNKKNQIFYPVGSVWTCKLDATKSNYKRRVPKSENYCGLGHGEDGADTHSNEGPEKETILVSGDVKSPSQYKLLWNSKSGCVNCQEDDNGVQIWRPIPPKGYVALGDVAVPNNDNSKDLLLELNIKCVPEECVRELSLGPMVWNNKNVNFLKFNNYLNFTKNNPYFYEKPTTCTFWSAGSSDIFEENRNNINFDLEDDGGYNLFRVIGGKGYSVNPKNMKNMKAYKIKDEYLLPAKGVIPKDLELSLPKDMNPNPKVYKDKIFFGSKPKNAVLTNVDSLKNTINDAVDAANAANAGDAGDAGDSTLNYNEISINGFDNEPKRIYLVDDNNKRQEGKPDTYFLKTYNDEKKDYSACLVCSESGSVRVSKLCDRNNDYHIWNVIHSEDDNNVNSAYVNLRPKGEIKEDDETPSRRILRHYYDNLGRGHYILTSPPEKIDNPTNAEKKDYYRFKYDTIVYDALPNTGNM